MLSGIKYHLLVVLVLLVGAKNTAAQNNETDTSGIIEKIVEKIDTVVRIVVPDSSLDHWSDKPLDSMLFRNKDTRLKKELYNLIVKSVHDTLKTPTTNTSLAAMDGKIIRRIEFDHVDIFAPSIADTGYIGDKWVERTVSRSHNHTRESILKRYLLLKPGDILDVFLASENEKILRELSFITDARFVPRRVKNSTDSIDLILYTQDRFPYGMQVELVKSTLAMLELSHHNVLGLGHRFEISSFFNTEHKPYFGYGLSYGSSNIGGTFTTGRLDYIHRWNQETYQLNLNREFKSTSFRNAGGISLESTHLIRNVDLIDTLFREVDLRYINTDLWYGRILMPAGINTRHVRSGLYAAGRINIYNNLELPVIEEDYLYPFRDRTMVLFSTGLSSQGFRKDNLIYTFGRPEDVPFGYLFDVTGGLSWTGKTRMPYLSLGTSYGNYRKNNSYFYGSVRYGTFISYGTPEQGTFKIRLQYFSALHEHNRYRYRNFVNFHYERGINRYPGEFISISDEAGIEGLISNSLRGNDKIVLNLESVFFTPYVIFGFHFAFFGGIDLGLIRRQQERFNDSRLFSGLNAGIKIRNDQLVFDTFVIRFAVYPGKPGNGTARYVVVDSEPGIRLNDFFPDKPEIVPY